MPPADAAARAWDRSGPDLWEPPRRRRTAPPAGPQPGRRTVTITGQAAPAPAPRVVALDRRRPRASAIERLGPRPDRLAFWAVLMGVLLVVVAATSGHG